MIKKIVLVIIGLTGCAIQPISTQEADTIMTGEAHRKGMTGWSQSGDLITGNVDKKVSMQADFEHGAYGAGAYTLEFNTTKNPASNDPIFAEALVSWRVEGNSVSRRLNISDGASLTGVGQAVRVVMYDATSSIFGAPNGSEYTVSVQVAPGTRGANKQPPTLVPKDGINPATGLPAAGGSGFFPVAAAAATRITIPQDAGIISVYITVASTVPLTEFQALVVQLNNTAAIKNYDPRDFPDWVPVTPGSDAIDLINNIGGGGASIDFSVTFGVDG